MFNNKINKHDPAQSLGKMIIELFIVHLRINGGPIATTKSPMSATI
jgi:hypothetical protein